MSDRNKKKPGRLTAILTAIRNIFGLNIGTMMFGLLFIYMLFSTVLFLTSENIESYQVISGPLARNETYTGFAIREEKVYQAESNGYVNYYAREGNKINANGAVYGISSTKIPESDTTLNQEDLSKIRSDMLSFAKGYNSSKFNSTYGFKYQLEGSILQYAGVTEDSLSSDTPSSGFTSATLGNQTIYKAASDGIVLYCKDGYEGITADTITAADFNQNSYHETDLKTNDAVKAGDDIYTLITDERWSLLIPLSEKQAAKLADRTAIRVKFLKDGMTQSGEFSIREIDGAKYGKIDFNRGLIRYATDRFLEIELVTNTVTGLKIPLSSIVTKEFYTIPSEYSTVNESSQEVGFMMEGRDENGEKTTIFKTVTIYARISDSSSSSEDEEHFIYYVDKGSFKEGDAIISQSNKSKYIVGDIGVMEGVYCINKGYAVFRRIELLDQNEEYAIVSKNTSYGLSRYDHIVRNADAVDEEEILY